MVGFPKNIILVLVTYFEATFYLGPERKPNGVKSDTVNSGSFQVPGRFLTSSSKLYCTITDYVRKNFMW